MRTTVVLPDELKRKAQRLAAERGLSMGELIRKALEEVVERQRPKAKSFGLAGSGEKDIGHRTGELYRPDPWRS
jgi:predicted transcriptional regulator